MRNLLVLLCLLASVWIASAETEITGLAWPALSHDGKTLAFEWFNDLWVAPSTGGEARRVVKHSSREAYPEFSPDDKRLFFSSERSGSAQIYSVNLDGTGLKKHSDQTEGNILELIARDGSYAIARGLRESAGYKPFRLLKIDLRKDSREIPLFDATAHSVSISPDGKRFLFCRGGEQMYRNGYTGSRASQIHCFDSVSNTVEQMIVEDFEARSPLWRGDGKSFYYASSKTGTFNIWLHHIAEKTDTQLTFFKDDAVVLRAISGDGKILVFRAGQNVYRFEPDQGGKPEIVNFFTNEKMPDRSVRKEKVSGTPQVAFAPDGHRIVFSSAGELWTMAPDDKELARLTTTDDIDEREPVFSLDGAHLFFLKDDGLKVEIISAGWNAGKLGEAKILPTDSRSKSSLRVSPDGSWLSWLEATGDIFTMPTAGGEVRLVMKNWDMPTYDWSPDGNWLVVAAKDKHANRDIFIVPADASREPYNITLHPAYDGSPEWSPDGKSIVFLSRRDSDGLARLMIAKVEKISAESDKDFEVIAKSIKPLATDISEPTRLAWSADSKAMMFQSRATNENIIFSVPLDGGEVSQIAEFRGIPAGLGKDGSSFWKVDRVPVVLRGGVMSEFKFSFSVAQDRSKRSRLGFRRIWRTLFERFYDQSMNSRDWPAALGKYEEAAARSLDSRQFDRVVAQMLGELNASHLTFRTRPWGIKDVSEKLKKPTAHLGIIFENTWHGPLIVKKVIEGAPISWVSGAPQKGDRILRIAGQEVDAESSLDKIFNGAKGSPLSIVVASGEGKPRTLELIPISYEKARLLDREAKTARNREIAAGSGRGIAYLPFRRMKIDDLRKLTTEVYRASLNAEGLILDLRDNSGGRVADELLSLFCQPVHSFTVPRGGSRGYPADRRVSPSWEGPMIVLCNENTFSNAEIFCHAFKQLGRGKLVGQSTNGGVISAVAIKIPEVGELQIPFRGWFDSETGQDLELNGAKPDLIVPFLPADQIAGHDPQLEAAVGLLSSQLAEKRDDVKAILKSDKDSK